MAENRLEELKQTLENRLMEMANLISRREYNLGLVKGRQALEQIVREYAKSGRVMYTDLADTIESLYQAGQIARETRDAFHNIRLLGNKAVHEGDNSPEDAERSYYLLRKQIEVFLNRELQRADRTPVGVAREDAASQVSRQFAESSQYQPETRGRRQSQYAGGAQQTRRSAQTAQEGEAEEKQSRRTRSGRDQAPSRERGERQRSAQAGSGRSQRNRQNRVPTREDRLRAQRQGNMRGRRDQNGVQPQDLLRILIPVICIILLIILIRSCARPAETDQTQTTPVSSAAQTESTIEAAETEPETETTEAAAVRYKVKGSAVNARYADNQNRVYEQLSAGTEIGEVTPIEGSDFVKFQRDGVDLVINKNYIEPIEETEDADSADAETTAEGEGTPEEGEQ